MLQPHGPTVPLFFSLSRNGFHSRDLVIHHGSFKTGDVDMPFPLGFYIIGVTLRASLPTSVRFKQALEKDAVYFAQGAAVSKAISSVSA